MKARTKPAGRKGRKPAAPAALPASRPQAPLPIVGIGASAGGLEALEHFLSHVPKACGMAFVVIQHLDPTRKGLMPELLQRATDMRVIQVKDRTVVQPDCVYVIPPNKDMSILHGALHLLEPAMPRGLRLPIDLFLRSLAQDRREQAVGVILSGMGSDGTLGLRAIKEHSGLALVQDPATAKFDGMPRSAIDAGVADIVAPVDELPARITAYRKHAPKPVSPDKALASKMQGALEQVIILLRTHTGHDFSLYKQNTFYRRIERRMGIHQLPKITDYIRYLGENTQELDLLFKELLIGVTSFFRDPAAWEVLREKVIPALVAGHPPGGALRIWAPGCSTGEEAYSLAIVFKEALTALKIRTPVGVQVFATDIDKDAIDKARQGLYPESIVADVSPKRLKRFFTLETHGYRVKPEIRELVIFAPQSLVMDPPFTKLDFLSCRNLMIYLAAEMQQKLMPLFHYSLRPGGILFLGSAETVGAFTDLFVPVNSKLRIYRRTEVTLGMDAIDFPFSLAPVPPARDAADAPAKAPRSLQSLADQFIQEHYAPPAVVVDDQGNILYVSGRTGKYLEPAAGKANWNVFAMAHNGLRAELTSAFHGALGRTDPVVIHGLNVGTGKAPHMVDVTIQRLEDPEALRGLVLIVFTNVPPPAPAASLRRGKGATATADKARLAELERKWHQARLEAQSIRQEMQAAQEETRSINEEQQSTNEELQSTNEELTTSKEEMQSLNEELQTVNIELQAKVDELSRTSSDMKNLLNSTDIATLFLDRELNVRRFTHQAAKVIKLIPGDVGRPITDLASDLLYPELPDDVREVLHKLGSVEKAIPMRDGRWFTVRIMPYRTHDDRIDGVVITFADITASKQLEAQLREKQEILKKIVADQAKASSEKAAAPRNARGADETATADEE